MSDEYQLVTAHTLDKVRREAGYRFTVAKSIGDWLVDDIKVAVRVGATAPKQPTQPPARVQAVPWRPAPPRCCGWNK